MTRGVARVPSDFVDYALLQAGYVQTLAQREATAVELVRHAFADHPDQVQAAVDAWSAPPGTAPERFLALIDEVDQSSQGLTAEGGPVVRGHVPLTKPEVIDAVAAGLSRLNEVGERFNAVWGGVPVDRADRVAAEAALASFKQLLASSLGGLQGLSDERARDHFTEVISTRN